MLEQLKLWGGYALSVLFCGLWLRGCGALSDCQAQLAAKPAEQVTATQGATQTAKANVRVQLVYKDRIVEVPGEAPRPLPCPDVTIDADSTATDTHWQSLSHTASPVAAQAQRLDGLKVFVGAGYLTAPVGAVGLGFGPLRLQGLAGLGFYGGLLNYDLASW